MLPGAEARCANHSGETISEDYNRFIIVVLMRDYRSQRKASDGVAGRKSVTAVGRPTLAAAL